MATSLFISALLIVTSVFIHYEVLRYVSARLPDLIVLPRMRVAVVVLACIFAHLLEVTVFATAYWAMAEAGVGELVVGQHDHIIVTMTPEGLLPFKEYIYFSVVTYSTLGFGDLIPGGPIRLVAGVESLLGLILVGWSASFTYLMMERLWLQRRRGS